MCQCRRQSAADSVSHGSRSESRAYAGQVESDYAAYKAAIADGRVSLGDEAEESSYELTLDPSTGVAVSVRAPETADPGPESS